MTNAKEQAIKAMLNLSIAVKNLREAATQLKALHMQELTPNQTEMVNNAMNFGYADFAPSPTSAGGDCQFWKFKKFIE